MPEEVELDPREDHEKLEELLEEHEAEVKAGSWLRWVSLSTAILAVIAAIAALQSGTLVNEAILSQGKAVQYQAQASDIWAEYQAKSIKGATAGQTAEILSTAPAGAENAAKYRISETRYNTEKAPLAEKAKELEKERDTLNRESGEFMHKHHTFAYCVTFTQVAIALSAIAALIRRRPIWFGSMIIGVIGLFFLIKGFMLH